MKVLILNLYYEPDLAATAQLMKELAEDLAAGGIDVSVIASRPSYSRESAEWQAPPRSASLRPPCGDDERNDEVPASGRRNDPGWGWAPPLERRNGVMVYRVRSTRWGRKSVVARALNYLTFYVSAAVCALRLERQDVILALSSPPYVAVVGVLLRWVRGTRLVYGVQDLIPDSLVVTGVIRSRLLAWLSERASMWLLRTSDHVIAIGRRMAERIVSKGVPDRRITTIHNWVDCKAIRPLGSESAPPGAAIPSPTTVLYAGNLGLMHDIETLFDALRRLRGEPGVGFLFVGGGVQTTELEKFVASEGIPNVRFQTYCRGEEYPRTLNSGDIHLVLLRKGLAGSVIPTKIFPAMAAGKAVVAVCPADSEIAQIITEHRCGMVVPNGDGEGLARAILSLAGNRHEREACGERARRAAVECYDRSLAVREYRKVLETVAGRASL